MWVSILNAGQCHVINYRELSFRVLQSSTRDSAEKRFMHRDIMLEYVTLPSSPVDCRLFEGEPEVMRILGGGDLIFQLSEIMY